MTIDATDYEPRAADDRLAFPRRRQGWLEPFSERERWRSIVSGYECSRIIGESPCHQLGCEFSELPHAI